MQKIEIFTCGAVLLLYQRGQTQRVNTQQNTHHVYVFPDPDLPAFHKISPCNSGTFVKDNEVELWFYLMQPVLALFELSIPTYAYISET